jgi:alpha-mannosidase
LFSFWFNAGDVRERLDAIDREALVKNERPFALSFFPPGMGNKLKAGIKLSDKVVQVTTFKKAEAGNAVIVRLFEPTGRSRSTTLELPFAGVKTKVSLGGFELKTLKIDPKSGKVTETDLLEKPIRG